MINTNHLTQRYLPALSSAALSTVAPPAATGSDKPATIIDARHVSKSFTSDKGAELSVLGNLSFELHEGEIVAILGRSGAGKSTFLRILAGLVSPSEGTVTYRGTPLTGPNPGVALVFQTFALMPWLTVQANVELGLQTRGVPRSKRTAVALAAIDAIGLDGFESAYPKELSGGMRQRVGIARALVLQPDSLFMDEPFSALDVLTAENLRQEVLNLWKDNSGGIKSILIVTHNIEEAVQMADRVVVLGSHPGHLIAQMPVNLPRPRDKHSAGFEEMVDTLYSILTGTPKAKTPAPAATTATAANSPASPGTGASPADSPSDTSTGTSAAKSAGTSVASSVASSAASPVAPAHSTQRAGAIDETSLPNATPGGLAGLIDMIAVDPEGVDLADLASSLSFEVDDLFPLVDAGSMLGVLSVKDGHVTLTKAGMDWENADILEAKQIFARLALDHAPLVRTIDHALKQSRSNELHGELFLDLLRNRHTDESARQQFHIAVSWGRYGELFDYDADDDTLTLDEANQA